MRKHLLDRRHFLSQSQFGLAGIALTSLLHAQQLLAEGSIEYDPVHPFKSRPAQLTPRAKNCIVVFCAGAVSHVDFWEHKPELIKYHGKPLPGNERLISFQGENGALQKPLWQFNPCGESGKMLSSLVPHIGKCADDICFLHSVHTKSSTHGPAENLMSTGFNREGYPGIGAWVTYGLGTENQNLPAFVRLKIHGELRNPARIIGLMDSYLPHFKGLRLVRLNQSTTFHHLSRPGPVVTGEV